MLFRTIGPLLLRGGLGGGAAGTGSTTSSSLDDDFSDEDEDDDSNGASNTSGRKVNVALPTFAPFDDESSEDTNNRDQRQTPQKDGPSKIDLLSAKNSASNNLKSNAVR